MRAESATCHLLHDRRGVLELRVKAGTELLGVCRQCHRAERERRCSQRQSEFLHKPSSCLPNADTAEDYDAATARRDATRSGNRGTDSPRR
jgi:hypothetical protein